MCAPGNAVAARKVQLATIFAEHGEAYRKNHKLPLQHRKVLFAIEACRSSTLGSHVELCERCAYQRITYNSCRNRHCPKCQKLNREKWVEKLSCTLLPVRYFHIVFTLPSELNRLCLVNQKILYDLLFAAASQTILSLAGDPKHLGAQTGLVALLHTWGQTLTEHPHLHTMVPAGGWSEWNGYWKNSRKKFFIPVKVLSRMFRGKYLAGLKAAYLKGILKFEGTTKELQSKKAFMLLLDSLYQKDWVVYTKPPFKSTTGIVKYLGNYSHRVAISNERIEQMHDDKITFGYKDYKAGGQRKWMTLDSEEFIRRFLLHVLPAGYCKIRYYGIYASRNRSVALKQCKQAMGIAVQKSRFEGLSWQEVLKLVTGFDVTKCPGCKNGIMLPAGALQPERAPPKDPPLVL
ncbi:MAG: IS91 family transposase [Bacteroidetes bacterium]|nr:IS91 family transposase [Bacteroidota bacterium]